jgi:hypothetical protein
MSATSIKESGKSETLWGLTGLPPLAIFNGNRRGDPAGRACGSVQAGFFPDVNPNADDIVIGGIM